MKPAHSAGSGDGTFPDRGVMFEGLEQEPRGGLVQEIENLIAPKIATYAKAAGTFDETDAQILANYLAVRVAEAFRQVGWDCAWSAGLCMCQPEIAQKCAERPASNGELIPPLPVFVFQGKAAR